MDIQTGEKLEKGSSAVWFGFSACFISRKFGSRHDDRRSVTARLGPARGSSYVNGYTPLSAWVNIEKTTTPRRGSPASPLQSRRAPQQYTL